MRRYEVLGVIIVAMIGFALSDIRLPTLSFMVRRLLVMDWMEANGISMTGNNYENLRMKFQRIKDAYKNKAGINVSRGYKHENP